ncbi:MAG: hypothetical protein GY715_02790 [Planctomycetes bacterium]|nr:hypothetical protein [Planctomycetota bacterium]
MKWTRTTCLVLGSTALIALSSSFAQVGDRTSVAPPPVVKVSVPLTSPGFERPPVPPVPPIQQAVYTYRVDGRDTDEVFYDVIETQDGGMAAVGYTVGSGSDVLLVKLTRYGRIVRAVALEGFGHEEGRAVVEVGSDLFVTGWTDSFGGGGESLLLAKFSANLDHQWMRILTDDDGDRDFRGYDLILDSDGAVVITGFERGAGGRYDLLMAKFETDGDPIGNRTYHRTLVPTQSHAGYALVEACGGDYVVVGERWGAAIGEDILVARFESDLSVDFGWWIDDNDQPGRAHSIVHTQDCGFALTGVTNNDLFVSRRDSTLDPVWQRTLAGTGTEGRDIIEYTNPYGDNELVVAGEYSTGSDTDVLLARWDDESGQHLSTDSYGDDEQTEAAHGLIEHRGMLQAQGFWGGDALGLTADAEAVTCEPDHGGPGAVTWNPSEGPQPLIGSPLVGVSLLYWGAPWADLEFTGSVICGPTLEHVVKPDGSGDFATIQDAIDDPLVWSGDEIVLTDGTFLGPGNKDLDFNGKAITVRSQSGDPESCIIDCEGSGRAFSFYSGEGAGSTVQNIGIVNGYAASGGAIYCSGSSPTITGCIIRACEASNNGGGIACRNSEATVISCVIESNAARIGGGFFAGDSDPHVIDSVIRGNVATSGGGLYVADSSVTLERSVISGNLAHASIAFLASEPTSEDVGGGGGIYSTGSGVDLLSCTVSGNLALHFGGGVFGPCGPENTIIWGNGAETGVGDEWYWYQGTNPGDCCNDLGPGLDGFAGFSVACQLGSNIEADPMFCAPEPSTSAPTTLGDYSVCAGSPVATYPTCGLIGALDVACQCGGTPWGDDRHPHGKGN